MEVVEEVTVFVSVVGERGLVGGVGDHSGVDEGACDEWVEDGGVGVGWGHFAI